MNTKFSQALIILGTILFLLYFVLYIKLIYPLADIVLLLSLIITFSGIISIIYIIISQKKYLEIGKGLNKSIKNDKLSWIFLPFFMLLRNNSNLILLFWVFCIVTTQVGRISKNG